MPQELTLGGEAPLTLGALVLSLGIGVLLSLVLRWHFERFGSTLSNRQEFAQVFPFVLLTTVLIISVVKSSLALSLGLVGALSIVRFRTPIKEPEELAYLFIAIAMGLGLGANQILPTVVAGLGIMGVMAALKWSRRDIANRSLYLSLDWNSGDSDEQGQDLGRLTDVISRHADQCDLRRFDAREGTSEATYLLAVTGADKFSALAGDLRRSFPGIGITFLDQNQMPSV